jgi:hypothetical protein
MRNAKATFAGNVYFATQPNNVKSTKRRRKSAADLPAHDLHSRLKRL